MNTRHPGFANDEFLAEKFKLAAVRMPRTRSNQEIAPGRAVCLVGSFPAVDRRGGALRRCTPGLHCRGAIRDYRLPLGVCGNFRAITPRRLPRLVRRIAPHRAENVSLGRERL